ncbi:uncharacterized protein [Equus caballus]|uniref:uncharacterized protein isoform X2 n=1 Tax=Equus caballus TaxID=9796 RepID=UPI0038B3E3CE
MPPADRSARTPGDHRARRGRSDPEGRAEVTTRAPNAGLRLAREGEGVTPTGPSLLWAKQTERRTRREAVPGWERPDGCCVRESASPRGRLLFPNPGASEAAVGTRCDPRRGGTLRPAPARGPGARSRQAHPRGEEQPREGTARWPSTGQKETSHQKLNLPAP